MRIAVVTGASSGMGKEFAKQIDDFGFDEIWGIALDQEGLDQLKSEMKTNVRSFALDLTKESSFEKYKNELKENNVTVELLINCSGFGKFGSYEEIPLEQSCNIIDLNCKGTIKMTELTLPYMKEGGRIVEMASISAFAPIPYVNVYAASKAFIKSYSLALGVELKPRKISVTCVCPFWTKTQFFNRAKQPGNEVITYYATMYDPKKVIKKAVKDTLKRKKLSLYGFMTNFMAKLVKFLPTSWFLAIWIKQQNFKKKYWNK
jgi:short-subunit dehydrogenase